MAKELIFKISGAEYASAPVKLERKKIYGWSDLVATDKAKGIQELFVRVDKQTFTPQILSMRQGTQWTTITVSNVKKTNIADSAFTFPAKDYPQAEIVDLRGTD